MSGPTRGYAPHHLLLLISTDDDGIVTEFELQEIPWV